MYDKDQRLKERLKRKKLVYLYAEASGPGIGTYRHWAIEIDPTYPWAGGFTDLREDATAFTPAAAKKINRPQKAWSYFGYSQEAAPKDHDGRIVYLPEEISGKARVSADR